MVAISETKVTINGCGYQIASVFVAGFKGTFKKMVGKEVVVRTAANESLVTESQTRMLQNESGVKLILRN